MNNAKVFFVLLLIVLISACERKNCSNVTCPAGQTCYQGNCLCPNGYQGSNCADYSYEKFIGSYPTVTESCNNATPPCNFCNYSGVYIYNDPNYADRLQITNLFGQGVQATALILNYPGTFGEGTDIQVPYQSQGSLSFEGYGTFNPNTHQLIINFNYTFNGLSYGCTHTFYKY